MRSRVILPAPRVPRSMLRGLVLAAVFCLPVSAMAQSPWTLLEKLRTGLQSVGPQTAAFTQTYVPAGFSSGDQESGHLSLWLPDCMRWSYEDPQVKNFLVCEGEVYYWTDEEPGGRHYQVDPEREAGLDLLLLSVDRLRERYVASSDKDGEGRYEITLVQPAEEGSFSAKILLDPSQERLERLEYTDAEGNTTRFMINEYERLAHTALFKPPSEIEWTHE